MTRIAFVLLHPSTHSLASFIRVKELSLNLEREGYESFILTPYERSYKISKKVRVIQLPNFPIIGAHLTPEIIRSKIYETTRKIYYNSNIQLLLLNIIYKKYLYNNNLNRNLLKIIKKYKIDIIQAEQDNAGLLVRGFKGHFKGPLVLDLHGIWTEELISAGTISRYSTEYFLLQFLMKKLVSSFDLILVLSNEMKKYVINNYKVAEKNVLLAPPGGYPRIPQIPDKKPPYKIVYAGTLTYSKAIDLMLESIKIVNLKKPDVMFLFTKKGEFINKISSLAGKLNVNIRFFWFNNVEKFYSFLSKCHIGLQPLKLTIASRINVPSKVIDYLSVGVPIVVNDVKGWTRDIVKYKAGVVTDNTPEGFAEGMLWLLENPETINEYSINALRLIKERYNWEVIARNLARAYGRVLSEQE